MATPTTKQFHIGDIISITDGSLVSPRHIGGVYDILNWMTGESLMTHQLPRAMRECEGSLRAQHPDIAAIKTPDWSGVAKDQIEAAVRSWLAKQVDIHGSTREVSPLPADDHTSIDPITELKMMRPDMPIIAINTTEES